MHAWTPIVCLMSITAQGNPARNPVATAALPIRSIELDEPSMADLEPLVDLIGQARVVALGEGSHGAGSDFRAKARLIRFLHERLGFDVILWEAGIYDVRYLMDALDAHTPPPQAAARALYAHWAASEEVASLLEYVEAERTAGRPIDIGGFDLQISRPFRTTGPLVRDLRSFFETDDGTLLPEEYAARLDSLRVRAAAAEAFATSVENEGRASRYFAPTYRALAALGPDLLHVIDEQSNALRARHSPRQIALIRQMLKSLSGLERINEPLPGDPERPKWDFVRRWNERELVNTANIDWYVHARYPDRKIIIWAHNAHVVEGFLTSNFSKFSAIAPTELPIRPSGLQIRTALGDELFSIMFTAYEGSVRRMDDALALTSKTVPLEPAPEGSLEERLHTAGFRYAILPLGAARPPFSDWLNTPRVGRIDTEFLPPQVLDWRRVADAMFFIDIVEPSMIAVP